jgi:integrase/recombinase XerD
LNSEECEAEGLIIAGIGPVEMDSRDGYAEAFIESLRTRSQHTARSYGHCIRRFLTMVGKPLSELSVADAAGYLASIDGLSPASKAHHISAVRSFLRFLQGQGIIPTTPLDVLRRPRVAITSMTRYLTQEEAETLLVGAAKVSRQCHLACAVMLLTGVRVAELAQAQWRHLFRDPEGRLGLLVVGKGGKERVVKVRDDLFRLLCEERSQLSLPTDLDARDTSALVPNTRGRPYHTRTLHKLVARAAEKAGLQKVVSPHWLRHSFATLAALGGAPAFQLQQDLGHARLETSQRYVHWATGLRDSAVDAAD